MNLSPSSTVRIVRIRRPDNLTHGTIITVYYSVLSVCVYYGDTVLRTHNMGPLIICRFSLYPLVQMEYVRTRSWYQLDGRTIRHFVTTVVLLLLY